MQANLGVAKAALDDAHRPAQLLHHHRAGGRLRRRQDRRNRQPRGGRHRAHGRGAGRLGRRQLQGDPGRRNGAGPAGAASIVDEIPGHTFTGHIDSFSPGSGSVFALLPPENATGNFTKIVQRVPVKILFDPDSIRGYETRLVPGLSVETDVTLAPVQSDNGTAMQAGSSFAQASAK